MVQQSFGLVYLKMFVFGAKKRDFNISKIVATRQNTYRLYEILACKKIHWVWSKLYLWYLNFPVLSINYKYSIELILFESWHIKHHFVTLESKSIYVWPTFVFKRCFKYSFKHLLLPNKQLVIVYNFSIMVFVTNNDNPRYTPYVQTLFGILWPKNGYTQLP